MGLGKRPAPRTAWKKGKPKTGGRKKGTPNKITVELKKAILLALANAHRDGEVAYLKKLALAKPNAFANLLGRLIPLEVQGSLTKPLAVITSDMTPEQAAQAYQDTVRQGKDK